MIHQVFIRLGAYYCLALAVMYCIIWLFPEVATYMEAERQRALFSADLSGKTLDVGGNPITSFTAPELTIPVIMSMLGALMLALPVAWVYRWTRPDSVDAVQLAQTLVLLPIAIALVVFLVKGSLALAFSLAGIVAVVRFRATLNDSRDAVYMFVVVGIGLAAGVQLLMVAFACSMIFNMLALQVYRSRFAQDAMRLDGYRLVAPPVSAGAPSSDASITKLVIETSDEAQAKLLSELILDRYAKRWSLDTVSGDVSARQLAYSVSLKRRHSDEDLCQAIRDTGGPNIKKVEADTDQPHNDSIR